jgi:bile acid-coenzyme A ligase
VATLPMAELLAWHAARDPDRVAVVCGPGCMTRAELDAETNRAAREFADIGVRAGDFVTIALPNSIAFYSAAFGALKLGATPMPISHRLPRSERDALIELASPALVVGAEASDCAVVASVPPTWTPDTARDSGAFPTAPVAESWKAMTSGGSTGRPKIIVAKVRAEYDPLSPPLGMRVDGVQLVPGPLYHQGPFMFSMFGLFTGATIVLMPRFDAATALALIERHKVDWTYFVPTMTHRIWRLPPDERNRFDLGSLNVVFSTGAPWPAWLKQEWIRWLGPDRIAEAYGGTESQGGTFITGREALERPGSVGRPSGANRIRVLDETGADLPAGEVGEVYFMPPGGPGSTYRYVGAEAKARDGWETLGDLGYLDDDGYLYLVDRRTDLIVTGGANVYPAEVEAALDTYDGIRSSAVIALPDDDLGHRVHAIVDIADDAVLDVVALRRHLAELLAPYKLPREIEVVHQPLRDDAGKVRRSALREARLGPTNGEGGEP